MPTRGLTARWKGVANKISGDLEGLLAKPIELVWQRREKQSLLKWKVQSVFEKDQATVSEMVPDWPSLPMQLGGPWQWQGQLTLDSQYQPVFSTLQSNLKINSANIRATSEQWQIRGIDLHWPLRGRGHSKARLRLGSIQWQGLRGSFAIDPWPWHFDLSQGAFGFHWLFGKFGGDLAFLHLDNQRLEFKSWQQFRYDGSLTGKLKNIADITAKLCLANPSSIPPLQLQLRYPNFSIDAKKLDLQGELRLSGFQGQAVLKNFKIFNWQGQVPETQFDFDANDFLLAELGEWLHFGKMQGTFVAYAHQVVMQSWLPTQFRGKVALEPLVGNEEIVFSARAMQNFTQLFTPEDFMQQLPGMMRWFAFGWPSDLIGGFNIHYAGLNFYSKSGSILVESLDPPDVVRSQGNHFLLYGPRFRIPINSVSYPVVLDAPGFSQFVSHVYYQLIGLQQSQSQESGENNDPESSCQQRIDRDNT